MMGFWRANCCRPCWAHGLLPSWSWAKWLDWKKSFWRPFIYYWSLTLPSSAKPGIWGPSTIKLVYFLSLDCFGRWFSHDLAATRYMRSPQLWNLSILGPSIVLEGGFHIMWWWIPHARYMWWWVPRALCLLSLSSCSTTRAVLALPH
jgi:hypothetical protein